MSVAGVRCGICGSERFGKLYDAAAGFSIVSCGSCGLWLQYPVPTRAQVNDMYRSYHEKWGVVGREEELHRSMRSVGFDRLLARVERFAPSGSRRLLDVGCATGICMEVAVRRGWDVRGIDISEKAAGQARERFGAKVEIGDLEELPLPEGHYDAVIMADVLEHLVDFKGVMEKVYASLRPGGIAAIVTVDARGALARLMGRDWIQIRREHLAYFSRKNLSRFLARTGFQVMRLEPSYRALNLYYVQDYLRQTKADFPHRAALYGALEAMVGILPLAVRQRNFLMRTGEVLAIARKPRRGEAR